MGIYGKGLAAGSRHALNDGEREHEFEWTGKSWSTPCTNYGTKPGYMVALGWSYAHALPLLQETPDHDTTSAQLTAT